MAKQTEILVFFANKQTKSLSHTHIHTQTESGLICEFVRRIVQKTQHQSSLNLNCSRVLPTCRHAVSSNVVDTQQIPDDKHKFKNLHDRRSLVPGSLPPSPPVEPIWLTFSRFSALHSDLALHERWWRMVMSCCLFSLIKQFIHSISGGKKGRRDQQSRVFFPK